MFLDTYCRNQQFRRILIRVFKVQVGGNKVILHHEDGVNDLTRSCHPHFMSGLGLRAGHLDLLISKDIENGLGLVRIAHMGGSRMGIDISYLSLGYARTADCHLQRAARSFYIRR